MKLLHTPRSKANYSADKEVLADSCKEDILRWKQACLKQRNHSAEGVACALASYLSGKRFQGKLIEAPAGFFENAGFIVFELLKQRDREICATIEIYLNLATLVTSYLGNVPIGIQDEGIQVILLAIQEDRNAFSYNRKVPHFLRKWLYKQRRKIRLEYQVQALKKAALYPGVLTASTRSTAEDLGEVSVDIYKKECTYVVKDKPGVDRNPQPDDDYNHPVLQEWIDAFQDETLSPKTTKRQFL